MLNITPLPGIAVEAQTTDTIMMIRPVRFRMNEQTAVNNYYQKVIDDLEPADVQKQALREFDTFVAKLREKGIGVIVINDTENPDTPDSIFPNNWISFHQDGRIGLYPMFAENRRLERRDDIIETLKGKFIISEVIDFSGYEEDKKFLEGTGSMILDRPNHKVYAAISDRTELEVLNDFCDRFGYRAVTFTANQTVNGKRLPIYHTNVMMCIAEQLAVLCAVSIDNHRERNMLINEIEGTGKEVILITEEQKHRFAGNMLQLRSIEGKRYMVMSEAAYKSLNDDQIKNIEKHSPIIHSSLDTIEALGGGSARCMMAEIFLPKK